MGRIKLQREVLPTERFRWSSGGLLVFDGLLQRGDAERATPEILDPHVYTGQLSAGVHP